MEDIRRLKAGLVFLLLMVLSAFSGAQTAEEPYTLKPQDIIRVQVYEEPGINAIIPIGRDGRASIPFIGMVEVAGKTVDWLIGHLKTEYARIFNLVDPRVSVTIEMYRPIRASVGGMVRQPGLYENFRPGDRLLSLINRGGGVDPDRADLRRATLRRANTQEVIPIDLTALMFRGDTSQNYEIEDGDELQIPEDTRNRILVIGAISRPGAYPYKSPMTLADIVAITGGPIPRVSKMSEIYIIRPEPIRVGETLRIRANFVRYIKN